MCQERFRVLGLRCEKFIKKTCEGHNCDFTYSYKLANKYIILLKHSVDSKYYELSLWEEEGECPSGWCVAKWGHLYLNKVTKFAGKTHVPIDDNLIIDLQIKNENGNNMQVDSSSEESSYLNDNINNKVFSFSRNGGDHWYPFGYANVYLNMFKELENSRSKEKRLVWLFYGASGSGKTYLSANLRDLDSYETDSSDKLPDSIISPIIVIGNKYNHTIDEIKTRIFDLENTEIILVNFQTQ